MDTSQWALRVCLCLLYACFNMPLIIGAVMCSFIIPIITKHSLCSVGVCVSSMKRMMVLTKVYSLWIFTFYNTTPSHNDDIAVICLFHKS